MKEVLFPRRAERCVSWEMKINVMKSIAFMLLFVFCGCADSDRQPEMRAGERGVRESTRDSSIARPPARTSPRSGTSSVHGIELFHDDGSCDQNNSPWSYEPGGQLAVVFTPPFYPARLVEAHFFVSMNGKPDRTFRVRVYGGSVADGPRGGDLLTATVTAAADTGFEWVDVDLAAHGIMIESGDFCIAMEWLAAPGNVGRNAQFLCADTSSPDARSWWKHTPASEWVRIESIAGKGDRDLMIRATVSGR
jgi:hypothetical protein